MGSCKDTFRTQLGRLLVHVVSPAHPSQQRKQIFEIVREPSYQEILRDCLSPSLQHGAKLVLYLSELIHNHPDDLTEEELGTAELLMNALKLCGLGQVSSLLQASVSGPSITLLAQVHGV